MIRARHVLALTVALLAWHTPPASAGTYTVTGTCGLWSPFNSHPGRLAVYPDAGCILIARNVYGGFTSAGGALAGWRLTPPAGATIDGFSIVADLRGASGWDAVLFDNTGKLYALCPGGNLCEGRREASINSNSGPIAPGTTEVVARVRCYATGGCSNHEDNGRITIRGSSLTIRDETSPALRLAGGSLLSGGWLGGSRSLVIEAADNVGIQRYEAYVGGALRASVVRSDCVYSGRVVPCPNGATTLTAPLAGIPDGRHTLTARAVDAAGNGARATHAILVDNTPPVSPRELAIAGGPRWQPSDRFDVRWKNPEQRFAPIVGARYELCPAKSRGACVRGLRGGPGLARISDLRVPREGLWNLRLWLQDSAGNESSDTAVAINGLGFDRTAPADVAFLEQDPNDPARLRVRARDAVSGISSGVIEVRRIGEPVWQTLATEVTRDGLTAFIDDEMLGKGVYELRATAVDRAGLQRSTGARVTGEPALLKLPLRMRSRLVAGRRTRHGLVRSPRVRIARPVRLRGRLTVSGRGLDQQPIEVWRQLLGQPEWKRIATVTTSASGRFAFRASRGPARTVRFRYPGTATIRGEDTNVALRVRADSTIRPSRRSVVNGEYVTFRGHLKGKWIPREGALVELQVYSRGRWRTFAQPRADSDSGRWAFPYRFETVSGRAAFRFRARIRRQPSYPFRTGASRQVTVRVRGL